MKERDQNLFRKNSHDHKEGKFHIKSLYTPTCKKTNKITKLYRNCYKLKILITEFEISLKEFLYLKNIPFKIFTVFKKKY